jgi:hypothetical protein
MIATMPAAARFAHQPPMNAAPVAAAESEMTSPDTATDATRVTTAAIMK